MNFQRCDMGAYRNARENEVPRTQQSRRPPRLHRQPRAASSNSQPAAVTTITTPAATTTTITILVVTITTTRRQVRTQLLEYPQRPALMATRRTPMESNWQPTTSSFRSPRHTTRIVDSQRSRREGSCGSL